MVLFGGLEIVAAGALVHRLKQNKRDEARLDAEEDLRRRGWVPEEEKMRQDQQQHGQLLSPPSQYPLRPNSAPPPGYMPTSWAQTPYNSGQQQGGPHTPGPSAQPYQHPRFPQNPQPQYQYGPPPPMQQHQSFGPAQYSDKIPYQPSNPYTRVESSQRRARPDSGHHHSPHGHSSRDEWRSRTPPPAYRSQHYG